MTNPTHTIPATDIRIGDIVIAGTFVVPNYVTVRTIETLRADSRNYFIRLNGITDIPARRTDVDVIRQEI